MTYWSQYGSFLRLVRRDIDLTSRDELFGHDLKQVSRINRKTQYLDYRLVLGPAPIHNSVVLGVVTNHEHRIFGRAHKH